MVGLATLLSLPACALAVPKAPPLNKPIVDQTSTLTSAEIDDLSAQIAKSRSEKSYQIGILIIPTLGNDEYIEGYSLKVAREWGIGESDKDNGVLLLVVKNDRKLRIEVGRGLEGDLTDVRAGRIVRNVIAPKFRSGDYFGGIQDGVNSIQLAVAGQADKKLATSSNSGGSSFGAIEMVLFFGFFGLIWLGSILGRSKSWWAGGVIGGIMGGASMLLSHVHPLSVVATIVLIPLGLLFDFLVSRNYSSHRADGSLPAWWAGGGSLGGGGGFGGGGSFGGGGFSGGGSSGSW